MAEDIKIKTYRIIYRPFPNSGGNSETDVDGFNPQDARDRFHLRQDVPVGAVIESIIER